MKETHKRVNIVMNIHLLERIDKAANKKGISRSAFLAEGAKQLLEEGEKEVFTGRLRWMIPKAGERVQDPQVLQQEVIVIHKKDDMITYSTCWTNVPTVKEEVPRTITLSERGLNDPTVY